MLGLGCGTATLTLLINQHHPQTEVIGLDSDQHELDLAWVKAAEHQLSIALDQGLASALPYPDDSFNLVLSNLLFHHLTRENKERA